MGAGSMETPKEAGATTATSRPSKQTAQATPDGGRAEQPARPAQPTSADGRTEQPARLDRRTRVLSWSSATMMTASFLLMITVLVAGPSPVVAKIPRTWPEPPLWLRLHPSAITVTLTIYGAIILGGAGVCCGLLAVRRGARPNMRLLLGAGIIAVVVLTLLPPGGSTDSLSYAAYGRIAALGHNPYVMVPHQLRADHDPIGLATTENWIKSPSLYGPVATAGMWAAAKLGGTNIASIIFWLKLLFGASFIAVTVTLDRLLRRRDPAARARAHLLWTVNPLMLWAVVGGAHADGLGAALGILGILIARTASTSPGARMGVARALAAGLLVGAAVGVKAPLFPLGLGLAWSVRRSWKDLAAVAAGGSLVLGTGYLIAGGRAITDLWTTGNGLVTFDSFWRLFYPPFGYTSEPLSLELLAFVTIVGVAALLAWRLPPGPDRLPAVRPALVLMLAWVLVYPLQRPWYDAAAFCLMAVYCASRLDWLMLGRAVPAALAVATGAANGERPLWLVSLIGFMGNDLARWARLAAVLAAVALCLLAAWQQRRPRPERMRARPALS
jgi:hypothetical protein